VSVNELIPLYRPRFNTLILRSHESRMTAQCTPVELGHAWVHTSGVATRMAALRLYRCRRNVRDRDYECDRGINSFCIFLLLARYVPNVVKRSI